MYSKYSLLLLCVLTVSALAAQEALPLRDAHIFGTSASLSVQIEMVVEGPSGGFTRELEVFATRGDGARVYAGITSPPFLRQTRFLQVSEEGHDPAQWIATSRGPRRLVGQNRDEAVFQSDFSAEDLSAIQLSAFEQTRSEAGSLLGRRGTWYVLRPIERASYTERRVFVDEMTALILGFDVLDGQSVTKRYRVEEFTSSPDGAYPLLARMETVAENSSTTIRTLEVDTTSRIPARYFNPSALR